MRWWVILAALGVVGCDRVPDGPAATVGDSAGVTIVTSTRPAWEGDGWTVGAEAELRVGVVDGDPSYQLSEVVGAVRLDGGTVVVADGGSGEVRFFGPGGEIRGVVGGRGAGPGEFTGLAGLGRTSGGGVWAYDFPLRRITWLDPGGAVTGLTTVGPEPPLLWPVGALPDGAFVLRQLWAARRTAEAAEVGLRRDPIAYVRSYADGPPLDTLGLFPGREVYLASEGGRGVMTRPVLARSSVAAIRGGRVVIGSQTTFELRELEPDGALARVIRLPSDGLEVDDGDLADYIDRYLEAVEPPERRPAMRAMLEDTPAPSARPAYGDVLADPDGHLWVGEWTVGPGEVPRRWTVIGPDGRWLGAVEMPEGFDLMDVGREWIVGVERDAMDVEQVVVYRLSRGGAS
jgi:hypothetical protein